MPPSYRRKRRISFPRRSKLRNRKSEPIRKKHHLKRGGQPKHRSIKKYRKNKQRKPNSTSFNDSKTLQPLRQNNKYMTTKAKEIMISFVKNLYKWVSVEAERLRRERKRSSIGFIEMRSALKSITPGKCKCEQNSPKTGGSHHMKTS